MKSYQNTRSDVFVDIQMVHCFLKSVFFLTIYAFLCLYICLLNDILSAVTLN